MDVDNVIIGGYFKKYDNNLIEYDILFKFGSGEVDTQEVFGSLNEISCNTIKFGNFTGLSKSDVKYQENKKYFYNTSNMDIFSYYDGNQYKSIRGLVT